MIRILVAILIGLSLSVPVARAGDLLIRNVTVVSPERNKPLKDANVLLRDGRIVRIMKRLPQDHEGGRSR